MAADHLDRRGVWVAIGSYVLWGVMPVYWHLLKAVPSMQIIVHRIVWSTVLVCGWLGWKYGRGWLRETLAHPRAGWMLALSGSPWFSGRSFAYQPRCLRAMRTPACSP